MEIEFIEVSKIEENPWNPNVMSTKKFDLLVKEIENNGFVDPIQVVPLKSGKFRIIGGAHRYNAALILGLPELPAFILRDEKFQDEDLQKFITLRLNLIKGKMTPDKFQSLYNDLGERFTDDKMQESMGLVNQGEFDLIKKNLLKELKSEFGTTTEDGLDIEKLVDELKTVDDISKLLSLLYDKKASKKENPSKFILGVGTGGGKVVYFDIDKDLWDTLNKIKLQLEKEGTTMLDFLKSRGACE